MASDKMGLVSARPVDNGLNPQPIFQDTFSSGVPPPLRRVAAASPASIGDPGPKTTRELTGLIEKYDGHHHHHHHYFQHHQQQPQTPADFRRAVFVDDDHRDGHNWTANTRASVAPNGDGSDDDDDVEDEDEDDEDEVAGLELVTVGNGNNNSDKVNVNNSRAKIGIEQPKSLSAFGVKERNVRQSGNDKSIDARNTVTIADADGDIYYSQYLQGTEGSNAGQKEMGFENGCGFSGRKECSYTSESGESLRAILSDLVTGALMDDAMILPCGHSFGSGGVQHVIKMKACYICSQPVSEDSVVPNLSLRTAVKAFRREEELQLNRSSKRRRERYDQDKGTCSDSAFSDHPRGRGVQFPFAVTDRVIIKGNKRTPERFVGREAVVMTQCLNGWYVVKTLDNAESVKLQYRSLAKVSDNPATQPMSSKMTANWL